MHSIPFARHCALALSLGALLHTTPLLACGASPSAYVTLASVTALGEGASPREVPLVIQLSKQSAEPSLISFGVVHVEVTAQGSSTVIPGQVESFQDKYYWRPKSPLAPQTQYQARVSLENDAEVPTSATGPLEATVTFVTRADLLAPLSLASPTYSFVEGTLMGCAPQQMVPCGQCQAPVLRGVRLARVTIPAIQGGFSPEGYTTWMRLEQIGGEIAGANTQYRAKPGDTLEVPMVDELPTTCLTLTAYDASGQSVDAERQCFTAAQTQGAKEATGTPRDDATEAPTSGPTAGDAGGEGCQASGPGPAGAGGLLGLGLLAGLAARRRR